MFQLLNPNASTDAGFDTSCRTVGTPTGSAARLGRHPDWESLARTTLVTGNGK